MSCESGNRNRFDPWGIVEFAIAQRPVVNLDVRKPLIHLLVEGQNFHLRTDQGYADPQIIDHTFIFLFTLHQFPAYLHTFGDIPEHLYDANHLSAFVFYRDNGILGDETRDDFLNEC